MPQTTTNLGKVLIVSKGDHNPNTLYERLDTVQSNGSTFICLQDTTVGIPITDTVYWSPFAKSAYQNWLDAGNAGTYQDFLTWLQVPAEEERQAAEEARDLSQAWASNPENIPVSGSLYSSRHYMEKALDAQSAAEQAKTLAETAWDNFDDTYLGAKATDPTVDNDGGVLKVGAMYFNSVSKIFKVWDGSAWITHPALESARSQSTTKAPTSKLLDDELKLVEDKIYFDSIITESSDSVLADKIFSMTNGLFPLAGFNFNIFNLTNDFNSLLISCTEMYGSGASLAYGFFSSESPTIQTLLSGITFNDLIAESGKVFTDKKIQVPSGAVVFAFVDAAFATNKWTVKSVSFNKEEGQDVITTLEGRATTLEGRATSLESRATSLESRATSLEGEVFYDAPFVQTHISEQNGFIYTNGSLDTNSSFKIRVFDLTDIKSVRVQLGVLGASGANAFAFYSVTTGFSIANFISGVTFAALSAAGKDVTVDVPAGALRLLICEFNANISTYTITGYSAASMIDNFNERITAIEEVVNENVITCRGDSITAATYPANLQTLFGANYSIVNLGVGSAWIQDISARQGGVPFLLLNDLEIPADNTTEVSIPSQGVFNKYQSTGTQIAPIYNLATAMLEYSPCMIDNEEFIMTLTNPGSGYNANVTIRRVNIGNAFTIKAGTAIYPKSLNAYRDVLATVFFMGTNNTQSYTVDLNTYADTIINYHKDCLKLLNNSNFLILGLFNLSQRLYTRDQASSPMTDAELLAQNVAYELKMQNEFGLRFINLRKYLSSAKAIKDAVKLGYMTQATADTNAVNDATWQNKGCAAYSFMLYSSGTDFTHPNSVGYKMIAWYVFNALKKLGI